MAKTKLQFLCSGCGHTQPRWAGQCSVCKEWNTLTEFKEVALPKSSQPSIPKKNGGYAGETSGVSQKIDDVRYESVTRIITGIGEFDRVMGGGVAITSVNLLSGDPGAGKTTLLSMLIGKLSLEMKCLYATGEEGASPYANRFKNRLKIDYKNDNLELLVEADIDVIMTEAVRLGCKLLVVDSIQAVYTNSITGTQGSVSQVKGCTLLLNRLAKEHGITILLVGHVTKGSELAGPNTLKHIIDGIFHIEVNESGIRTIRPSKNRYGDTDTVGIFQMVEHGMISVDNPSKIFLSSLSESSPGSAICCIRDGTRNLLLEVQSLVTEAEAEYAQRVCVGLNMNRLKMISAIIRKHGRVKLNHDVYVNLVGGLKLPETDTSADLSMAASLVSSLLDKPLPKDTVWLGELSLSGEVRPINGGVPRVNESVKHGFKTIILPFTNYHKSMEQEGVKIIPVKTIQEVTKYISSL